jgi:aryl-alcohol dehydrogenase-like predicted oxidoreductase
MSEPARERTLGATGLHTSALGLGAGPLGDPSLPEHEVVRLVHAAIDLGIRLVDTAPSYGSSEERLGRALAGRRDAGRRDGLLISTKVGYGVPDEPDWTGPCITRGVARARERLRVDVIDIVHLHSCGPEVLARNDVVDALAAAKSHGTVRAIAYSGDGPGLAAARANPLFDLFQTSFNLVDQTAKRDRDPRGWIGKRTLMNAAFARTDDEVAPDVAEYRRRWRSAEWPEDVWRAPTEIGLRFAAFQGPDTVLVGTRSLEHLMAAARAVEQGPLAPELVAAIEGVAARHAWPGVI